MLYPSGGREEPAASSWRQGVPRDQRPRCREIFSQKSSQGSVNIMWLLGLLLFLIINGFWWFVWGVANKPVTSSNIISQDPYGKYLVIEDIYYAQEYVGRGSKKAILWNFKATLKNTGSREVTAIEGYWHLVDGQSREHRDNIYISRLLSPGDSHEITMQLRDSRYFGAPGNSRKIVIEKVKLKEAANSP